MAQLKDLCNAIPAQFMRGHVMREINRRKAISYARRMQSLQQEENVFNKCATARPSKSRVRNRFSREEAGMVGNTVMGIHVSNNTVVVCRCKKQD